MKRYSYTPRRNGRPLPRATVPGAAVPRLHLLAGLFVVALVAAIGFLTRDGGGLAVVPSCGTEPCVQEPLSLGASASPTPHPSAAAAQPTPVRSVYPAPEITALSAMVIEEPCAAPLYAYNENTRYPPASLVKLMTALVASRHADLDAVITSPLDGFVISEETDGTVMGVELGERLSLRDLLYGLLLRSGNDAALIIAEYVAGGEEEFVEMMNAEAAALGLKNTHFTNSHGLDHVRLFMSARDAAFLGHEVLKDPELAEIVAAASYTPDWDKGPLENINLFVTNYPGAIGLKTGFTDTAQQTIVAAATRGGRTLTVAVMHSIADYEDAGELLDWAFASTEPACGS